PRFLGRRRKPKGRADGRRRVGETGGKRATTGAAPAAAKHEEKLTVRELVETVAVVLILVNLLRGFCAEAFVIPTGSMATTLLGEHLQGTCPACGQPFVV